METTENFKRVISAHLNGLAASDPIFAQTLKKENKSLDECINYILQEVKKSGITAWTDEDVYNLAVHYYDEDDLKATGAVPRCKIVTPYEPEITEQDKAAAKQAAIDKLVREEAERLRKKPVQSKKEENKVEQPTLSLFD
jgi:hypothetical protein